MPDPEDPASKHGPLLIEPAIAALQSLRGKASLVSFEIGSFQNKICFFVRADASARSLIESQLYAQYPAIDIEEMDPKELEPSPGQSVSSVDLRLSRPEIYPIKRHPQFDDILSRQNVDTLAGITSTLVRYPEAGMRGHIQIVFRPLKSSFRRRVIKFLPLLEKGFSKRFQWYAHLFARVHLSRGWRWWLLLPLNILMGGFRAWFSFLPSLSDATLSPDLELAEDPSEERLKNSRRSHENEDPFSAAADKANRLLFLCNVRVNVVTQTDRQDLAAQKLGEIVSSFRQFALPDCNSFRIGTSYTSNTLPVGFSRQPYMFSVEELATLWHFPNALVKTPNIDWVEFKKLEPPVDLPLASALTPSPSPGSCGTAGRGEQISAMDLTVLGEAVFRGHRTKFGIMPDDRRRHMYIIGKTGMGKSTLLENMIYSDIVSGKGVGVIDPHGDLIEAVLRFIPASRTNDVVLFDPADREFPLSFNMLSCPNPDQHSLVVSGLMSVFTKLWPDVWSGRMEHILRNALLALIGTQGNSMLGILRMFSDDQFRAKVVSHVSDHLVRSFWQDEYAGWSEKYRTEAIAAIQNKIGQLLSVPMIRNIVGQTQSKLSIRDAMDTGKIVLVNLSKGNIGEDNSAFLGSMLVTRFQLDAMSRTDIPEKQRKDFYLYVDEFQNFATQSFATILSEARKYRLNLTLANQYIGQLLLDGNDTSLKDAVFGNVGSMTSFQVGSDDAEDLSLQFEEMVTPKDILGLPKYHAYMRLMVNGMASKPFSVSTLPPPKVAQDKKRVDLIRRGSRERYCEQRGSVEDKISRWLESARDGRKVAVNAEKAKEKEAEEREKAKKKGMKLEEYRAWRDREMWTNDFNALRKKALKEELSADEQKKLADLQAKLEKSGGVPPPSKGMLEVMGKSGQR
ncbi:MAG: type IV secretion system DNA-binding domain-containing protein [Candidatus Peribacteraceae bacterium]|nr:type IV secretion system DNA-binding domain-containing protein [Candidatus Peribacteraceae bacterium]